MALTIHLALSPIDVGERIRPPGRRLKHWVSLSRPAVTTIHCHHGEDDALQFRTAPSLHLEQDGCLLASYCSFDHPILNHPVWYPTLELYHAYHHCQILEMRHVVCRSARCLKAVGVHILGKVNRSNTKRRIKEVSMVLQLDATSGPPIRARAIEQRCEPLRLLGAGGNGEVHLCRDTKMRTSVAVKTIHHEVSTLPPLATEILHFVGQHANIVHYHTLLQHPCQDFHTQLIFEYCELGDIAGYVNSAIDDVTPAVFIWSAFKQISNGLRFIHSPGVVHGDLKRDNILVCPPRGETCPTLKIDDFGNAEVNSPRDVPLGHFAMIRFQPPKVITRNGPESDIWALSCTIYQSATRGLPRLGTEEAVIEPKMWFDCNESSVPDGMLAPSLYKRTCHEMAFHRPTPERIDNQRTGYNKLLNFFIMRALGTNYQSRVTVYELNRAQLVLEKLAYDLLLCRQESILNRFDDGRDAGWNLMSSQRF
jgi:hypothetical protein